MKMELVQSRIVTHDVERLAAFYAELLRVGVTLNEYYVEVSAGPVTLGFSKRRFAEFCERQASPACRSPRSGHNILDFQVDDIDAEYSHIAALGVPWIMPPRTQPWGNRAMIFNDPDGHLINVFSRCGSAG